MPKIVDREAVRMDILMAFQRCIGSKPIDKISLRDIAAEADMSHPKLLNYFSSKNEIIYTYIRYTRDFISSRCESWFRENLRSGYASNLDYLNAFMKYVAEGKEGELRPVAASQTFVLGYYDSVIGQMVRDEFRHWHSTMDRCLREACGEHLGPGEAEALMYLCVGVMVCNYNKAMSGNINGDIMGRLARLTGQ